MKMDSVFSKQLSVLLLSFLSPPSCNPLPFFFFLIMFFHPHFNFFLSTQDLFFRLRLLYD